MSIAVDCDNCGKSYKVSDAHAGKRMKCKACGHGIAIPSGSGDEDDWGEVTSEPAPPPPSRKKTATAKPKPRSSSGVGKKVALGAVLFVAVGGVGFLGWLGLGLLTDSHEKLLRDQIAVGKKLVTVLKGITDEKSAKAAAPQIVKLTNRSLAILDRKEKLDAKKQLTRDEIKALQAKLEAEGADDFIWDTLREQERIANIPGAREALASAMEESARAISRRRGETPRPPPTIAPPVSTSAPPVGSTGTSAP